MATISDITNASYSGNHRADSLLGEITANWNYLLPARTALHYTFDCSPGSAIDQATSETLTTFNITQKSAATSILNYVASVTGLTFVETASGTLADFHFGTINISGATTSGLCSSNSNYSYTADNIITSYNAETYIYLDNVEFASINTIPTSGSSGYEILLHEIGHALGLSHPFDGLYQLPADEDNTNNTVMSYTDAGQNKSTFQSYDLLALTWIFGNDGLRGSYGFNSTNGSSLTPSSDTAPPTVLTFSPADEALNVAIASNIVISFNESIQRGTGNIILKNATGTVIATYDAATSNNLSLSGSTLTINPTADLAYSTGYIVEFAAGSIKDSASNNYAGSTSYNFTTAAATAPPPTTQSKDAQFLVLQPSSPSIVGAGVGDDTYLISGSMIPAGKSITISDALGNNSLQFAPGLAINSSQVTATALKLTLSNGAAVTVLGANKFTYEIGGNSTAGQNDPDTSYQNFIEGTLGLTIPTTGITTGGNLVIDNITPASVLASSTPGNDYVILQYASPSIVGAGAANDTYLISSALLPTGTSLTISDATGSNSIQLAAGLSITGSQVTSTALKLTLDTGATVTVLGANNFTYDVGGNTTAGIDQTDVSYATLVQNTLKATIPTSGVATGGAVVIGGGSTGTVVQGNNTVNATAANDVFSFDAVAALLDAAGTNTQAIINGFSTSADKLQINLPTVNTAITTLNQLNGQQGVVVQSDEINNRTVINFGTDANGVEPVSLSLIGVINPELVSVHPSSTVNDVSL